MYAIYSHFEEVKTRHTRIVVIQANGNLNKVHSFDIFSEWIAFLSYFEKSPVGKAEKGCQIHCRLFEQTMWEKSGWNVEEQGKHEYEKYFYVWNATSKYFKYEYVKRKERIVDSCQKIFCFYFSNHLFPLAESSFFKWWWWCSFSLCKPDHRLYCRICTEKKLFILMIWWIKIISFHDCCC